MACNITLAGIEKDCGASMGGVKRIAIALREDIDTMTVTTEKVAVTMVSSKTFKEFCFRPGTAAMTSTRNVDLANGVNYVETLLSMSFSRMETSKRVELEALAHSECVALVEDNNGVTWFLGYDEPLVIQAGDGGTGTARTDRNGYGVTLADESKAYPYESTTSIDSVI